MTGVDAGPGTQQAPAAPGRLGAPLDPAEAQAYLLRLRHWVDQRRADLDAVDRAVLRLTPAEQAGVTSDLAVALTFWKAISDRLALLETTFDGGRVGRTEAERLSLLVHGRLDATGDATLSLPTSGALAVSLPEACRLLDSLTRTLQARASLAPGAAESSQRVVLVRAAVERVRDQVPLVPAGSERDDASGRLDRIDRRLGEVVERARRGADVGGSLGPLEIDVATLERDLIVAAAERDRAVHDRRRTQEELAELEARAEAIRTLEAACLEAVTPAPTLAVPQVSALGPVPQGAAELAEYRRRVDRVARALDLAHEAYADALAERDEVVGIAGALDAMLAARADDDAATAADLTDLRERLRAAVAERPLPLRRARALVASLQAYADALSRPARKARP